MRRAAILLLCGTALLGADVTGKWSGAVIPGNNADSVPISLELRQKGSRVIGVAITKESGVTQLLDGAVAGDRIAFNIRVEKQSVHFELTVSGNRLQGQATGKRDDGSQDGPVALNLEKETPASAGPFAGKWMGTAEGMDNGQKKSEVFTLTLRQSGTGLTGAITDSSDIDHPLSGVKASGDRITFEVDKLQAGLTVAGDKLTGTGTVESGSAEQVLQLRLVKQPETGSTAAGASGRWDGTAEVIEDGQTRRSPISLRLHQQDSAISGKCVDDKGKPFNIVNGAIRGNKIGFDVGDQSGRTHFDLTLEGDELRGQAVGSGNERSVIRISAVRRLD